MWQNIDHSFIVNLEIIFDYFNLLNKPQRSIFIYSASLHDIRDCDSPKLTLHWDFSNVLLAPLIPVLPTLRASSLADYTSVCTLFR